MLHDENYCCAPDEVKIQPAGLIPIGRPISRSAGILPAGARASRSRDWRGQDANAQRAGRPRYVRRATS